MVEEFELVEVTQEIALPVIEPWRVLSGPNNAIWDDIFDWITNAIDKIGEVVSDWISWLWAKITGTIIPWFSWLWDKIYTWIHWLRDQVIGGVTTSIDWIGGRLGDIGSFFANLWSSITNAFKAWFGELATWFDWLWEWLGEKFTSLASSIWEWITNTYQAITNAMGESFDWLWHWLQGRFDDLKMFFTETILDWLSKPIEWIGNILNAIGDWFVEDIPDHSPRWTGIFETIGHWFAAWFYDFPKWFFGDFPERVAYGLEKSFEWVGDTLNPVIETFNDSIMSFAKALGPMSPDQAATNFSSIAKVGFAALAGLTGMTIAGELLHPLKRIGLGNLAAVIYDMTNYKMITGAFVGTMAYSMLQTPLRYYFNSLFTPMLIREADFVELLARGAFRHPELLQNPELSATMTALAPEGGEGFESSLVSYYGYRPEYLGLFRELANTRLGYFALAGVARTGFWDEAWFVEALARTGYSQTARAALLKMMYELYTQSKLQPVMSQIRKLYREGFTTRDNAQALIDEALDMPTLADVRMLAMDLEQVYESKSTALDITLRAFSRGVISESECRDTLSNYEIPSAIVDSQLYREKLGIIRRVSWTPPEATAPFQFVEE